MSKLPVVFGALIADGLEAIGVRRKSKTVDMKLRIEMVPEPLWGKNLRSDEGLGRYRWDKLRKAIMAERGKSCIICGSDEQPHGHEVWEYQETKKTGIARLIGVEIVCRDCHAIHHWGQTTKLMEEGAITTEDLHDLVAHFCTVNKCKPRHFDRHEDEGFAIWERRSKLSWRVDWGAYSDAVHTAHTARNEYHRKRPK